MHENGDPDPIGEETPRVCLGSTAVRCGLAVAGAKWRRFGDEGEAMLCWFIGGDVIQEMVRCRCCEGGCGEGGCGCWLVVVEKAVGGWWFVVVKVVGPK